VDQAHSPQQLALREQRFAEWRAASRAGDATIDETMLAAFLAAAKAGSAGTPAWGGEELALPETPERRRRFGGLGGDAVVDLTTAGFAGHGDGKLLEYIKITDLSRHEPIVVLEVAGGERVYLQEGGHYAAAPGVLRKLCEEKGIGHVLVGTFVQSVAGLQDMVQRPAEAKRRHGDGQLPLLFVPGAAEHGHGPYETRVSWSAGNNGWAQVRITILDADGNPIGYIEICVCILLAALLILVFGLGTATVRIAFAVHKNSMSTPVNVSAFEAYVAPRRAQAERRLAPRSLALARPHPPSNGTAGDGGAGGGSRGEEDQGVGQDAGKGGGQGSRASQSWLHLSGSRTDRELAACLGLALVRRAARAKGRKALQGCGGSGGILGGPKGSLQS